MSVRQRKQPKTRTSTNGAVKEKNKGASKGVAAATPRPRGWLPDQITALATRPGRLAMVVGVIAVVLYLNTLGHNFVFDDKSAVVENILLKPETPISWIFTHDFWGTHLHAMGTHKSYRPLTTLFFRAEAAVAGIVPSVFHFDNVVTNALACMAAVYAIVPGPAGAQEPSAAPAIRHPKDRRPKSSSTLSIGACVGVVATALVYTCHAARTESVNSVVGRADILGGLFGFLAFYYHKFAMANTKSVDSRNMLATALLIWASALCKESGFTVSAVCGVHELAVFVIPAWFGGSSGTEKTKLKQEARISLQRFALLAATGLVYVIGRSVAFSGLALTNMTMVDNPISKLRGMSRLLTALYVQGFYGWLLLWPVKLCCDYAFDVIPVLTSIADPRVVFIAAALLITLALTALAFYESARNRDPRVALALAWVFLPLFPASHIVDVGLVLGERLLYVPAFGMAVLVGYALDKFVSAPALSSTASTAKSAKGRTYTAVVALAVVVAALAARTIARNPDWKDRHSLFTSARFTYPRSVKARNEYAGSLIESHMWVEAEREMVEFLDEFKEWEEKDPDVVCNAYSKLSVVYAAKGPVQDPEKSLKYALDAVECSSRNKASLAHAHFRVGKAHMELDHLDEAIKFFRKAEEKVGITPCILGDTYMYKQDPANSIKEFRKCWQYTNQHPMENNFLDREMLLMSYGQVLMWAGRSMGREHWVEGAAIYNRGKVRLNTHDRKIFEAGPAKDLTMVSQWAQDNPKEYQQALQKLRGTWWGQDLGL